MNDQIAELIDELDHAVAQYDNGLFRTQGYYRDEIIRLSRDLTEARAREQAAEHA